MDASIFFDTALTKALLLASKDNEEKAKREFDRYFLDGIVNDKNTFLPSCLDLIYTDEDFNVEFLQTGENTLPDYQVEKYKKISKKKKSKGLQNLTKEEHLFYNNLNWCSLRRKAHILIEDHCKKGAIE